MVKSIDRLGRNYNEILQLLSYVAQTEREFIHQRQAEGIAVAKAQGVRLGRPPLAQPKEFPAVHQAWLKKEISAREAAWRLSVTHKTFLRRAQKLKKMVRKLQIFPIRPLRGALCCDILKAAVNCGFWLLLSE